MEAESRNETACLGVKAQEVVHPDLIREAGGCEPPDLTEKARMASHQNAMATPHNGAGCAAR